MTSDAFTLLSHVFGSVFTLFTSWRFPGTHVTPAQLGFFFMFLPVLFRFVSRVFGFEVGEDTSTPSAHHVAPRNSSALNGPSNISVSKK